jgi:hypothetical protein
LPISASIMWDPDGPGPEGPWLVVGGDFQFVGTVPTTGIARWNPATGEWAAIGQGIPNGDVRALAVLPDNSLVAGGAINYYDTSISNYVRNVVRWDGSAWRPLGTGATNGVNANILSMTVMPNGDLIAGGGMTEAGGVAVQCIARWNGAAWSALGTGITCGSSPLVFALDVLPNGDLLAAGRFCQAGTVVTNSIARWNGSAWSGFGTGLRASGSPATVPALLALPDGTFIAGGDITTAGSLSVNRVARWNGSAWTALDTGLTNPDGLGGVPVRKFARFPNGDIVAGGDFATASGVTVNNIARWNGSVWSALGSGVVTGVFTEPVRTLTVLNDGRLLAGGSLVQAGNVPVLSLALWDGNAWAALSPGTDQSVQGLLPLSGGGLLACGAFTTIGGVTASRVALWDGRAWSPLGSGVFTPGISPAGAPATCGIRLPNGDFVIGGTFDRAGAVQSHGLARWNGSDWSPIGGNVGSGVGGVLAVAIAPNGDIVIGGTFSSAGGVSAANIARWDGMTWTPVGAGLNGAVRALAFAPNGDLFAGGTFSTFGSPAATRIARWDGSQWNPLGSGMGTQFAYSPEVDALLALPSGDVIVGGRFEFAGSVYSPAVARWSNSSWSAMGSGFLVGTQSATVYGLALHPTGDIIAGGSMPGPRAIARWNGSAWAPLGAGLVLTGSAGGPTANCVAVTTAGEIAAGGTFYGSASRVSCEFARWTDSGVPWVALPPASQAVRSGLPLSLAAAPADGYAAVGPITYQWRHNGADIPGASGPLDPSGLASFSIADAQDSDAGSYDVIFTNPCGSATSDAAQVTISPPCGSADFNGDGDTGTDADIEAFFACLAGSCCALCGSADFNGDGDTGTDADIESFFRVLSGGPC